MSSECDPSKSPSIEEVAKSAERNATLELKRKIHQNFFIGHNKKAKPSSLDKIMKSIQIHPIVSPPLTSKAKARIGKPTDQKYQIFISMSENSEKLELPSQEILHKHDQLLRKKAVLKLMDPEPADYIDQAEAIEEELAEISPSIIKQRTEVADASEAYHIALFQRSVCKDIDDLNGLKEWSKIVDALVCLGIDGIVNDLKKIEEEKKNQEELKRKEELAAKRRETRIANSVIVLDGNNTNTTCNNGIINNENSKNKVQDKDGHWVEIDSLPLQPGASHPRDRPIAEKKKTKRAGTLSKRGLNNTKPYEVAPAKFSAWLQKPWSCKSKTKDPNTKEYIIRSGPNKKGHGLVLKNKKYLHCELCDCAVGDKHYFRYEDKQEKVIKADARDTETEEEASTRFLDEAVEELCKRRVEEELAGTSLSKAMTKYRMSIHEHQLMSNMPNAMLNDFKEAINLKGSSLLDIGDARDLSRTVGTALRKKQLKNIRWIMTKCYSAFTTASDGSPLGANAEAILIRMVRSSDHKIVELLISLKLFQGTLTGENIASHILAELSKFDLDLNDWKANMMDRAANNVLAVHEIGRLTSANPTFLPCFSHVISGPGKIFKEMCKELYALKKPLTKAIKQFVL